MCKKLCILAVRRGSETLISSLIPAGFGFPMQGRTHAVQNATFEIGDEVAGSFLNK